ncbi:PP2C family protein-serine/threonine phosphatase [Paracoccus sulfuroxidans]|uniref:Sigma-B regulation protein RsbU (Phosphoserine phosphatase) n=1 Tax=Paracoccus sulfuroxidans TaxID=384678 RepID=A0A562NG37_9RHOB|nr:fused response regulator/phosphatase [Paracoccus sulfuroxidans]TWI31038.1 sigma-B regulation protein RsbU (phosphoserine phosphatase) [Paracoccus sulfuroxidans]
MKKPAPPSVTPLNQPRNRLVLIVDDSRAQRRTLAIQLVRAGYEVAEAASGEEALEFCARNTPDIVISDWLMSGCTGPEFCRRFREMQRDRYGYFVLLTSRSDKNDIARGLQSGADDFLTKPVSGSELLARLSAGERILEMEETLRQANRQLSQTLAQLREAQAAIDHDMHEARRLQDSLIREQQGRFGDFTITLLMRQAGHIGGDLVGFFPINARRCGVFALDVSGHGVAAALLCARLSTLLSGATNHNIALRMTDLGLYDARTPSEVARQLNHLMLNDLRTDSYFTMVYCDFDFTSGQMRLVQAGHPYPILQRANGSFQDIGEGGLPIGTFQEAKFDEIALALEPGDRLLIASDGMTECEDMHGRPLGAEGLRAILQTNSTLEGEALLESLSWSLANYSGGRRNDDISAVLIERRPAAPPP